MLDGVGQQLVGRERHRNGLGLRQPPTLRLLALDLHLNRVVEGLLHGRGHGREQPSQAYRPAGAHLEPVDLGDGLQLAHGIGQDGRHLGEAR